MNTDTHEQAPILTEMRQSSWLTRIVGSIVIVAVSGLSVTPAIAVAQHEIKEAIAEAEANEISPEAEMAETILSVLAELEKVEAKLAAVDAKESDDVVDTSAEEAMLEDLTEQLRELDKDVMAGFDDIGTTLEDKDLPDVIIERHAQAVANYRYELEAVLDGVQEIREITDRKQRLSQTTELGSRLKNMKHGRAQQHFNPSEMPSRSLQPSKANKPKLTAMEFTEAYPMGDYRHLMANANGTVPTGDDVFTNPDWLSESDEVQLTQPIIDKAAELGNDPVQIYHWVRNNIEWHPNWGAKQTAQLTMELGSGNAMDIASLTIGLMRAAGIPARYVHGTIDVPEVEFRNWAGGFEDIDSAIDYGASGGIPLGPVTSGGQITKVRMEHIWVEVAVDFEPSRAAVNIDPDSWIAVDPSFQQFEYLDGLDANAISGIDVDQLAQDLLASATVNETEGWATGFDLTNLEAAVGQNQVSIENHIAANLPDSTSGDVVGGRRTIVLDFPALTAGIANGIVVNGARYASFPAALQQSMTFSLGTNSIGELVDPVVIPWAKLNNEKIILSFTPATLDDESVLLGLLPEGEITDASQLLSNIPAYLVNVIPELRLSDNIVMAGGPMMLGSEVDFHFNPTFVGFGEITKRYTINAGAYLGVAAVSNRVSSVVLQRLVSSIESIQSLIDSGDEAGMAQVTREQILGDVVFAGVLGYYAQYSRYSQILGQQQNAFHELAAGIGSFGYEPLVDLIFGVPRSLTLGGVVGNLPMVRIVGVDLVDPAIGGVSTTKKDFNFAAGLISSAIEHAVPEQLFDIDASNPPDAFSCVKALQLALADGQRIYQLTPANMGTTLPALNLDAATEQEIRQALLSGMEVITHTDRLVLPGYTGAGYIIFDPTTGDGAFKISGGANGVIFVFLGALLIVLGLVFATLAAAPAAAGVILAFLNPLGVLGTTLAALAISDLLSQGLFDTGIALAVRLLALLFLAPLATAAIAASPLGFLAAVVIAYIAVLIAALRR